MADYVIDEDTTDDFLGAPDIVYEGEKTWRESALLSPPRLR